jgi:thiamine transport system substrate-binding protein
MKTTPLIAALTLLAGPALAQDTPVLTVYTYDSFVTDWGPGPQIERDFEAICGCDLNLVGTGDGAAMLGRLRLEGARTEADVVLGLDTNLTAAAAATGLFARHGMADIAFDLPIGWDDDMFLPYDWGISPSSTTEPGSRTFRRASRRWRPATFPS